MIDDYEDDFDLEPDVDPKKPDTKDSNKKAPSPLKDDGEGSDWDMEDDWGENDAKKKDVKNTKPESEDLTKKTEPLKQPEKVI